MGRVVHFDITAEDPERAMAFYKEALGWEFQKWEGPLDYWLITTGPEYVPGINGGLGARTPDTLPGTTNSLYVESLDEAVDKVTAAGGTIVVPRMAVPGVGWMVYFQDTEGNVFGMMEADESAA